MSRPARPWYRVLTDSWYVAINREQHKLGPHPEGAPPPRRTKHGWNPPPQIVQEFHRLMSEGPRVPEAKEILVCQVCDLFLQHSEKHNDARTFKWYRDYLQDFCEQY